MDDEVISRELEMAETGILGLRLMEGVSLATFAERFGCEFLDMFGDRLSDAFTFGLLERDGDIVRLTERGRLLGNEVFERLLPEMDAAG